MKDLCLSQPLPVAVSTRTPADAVAKREGLFGMRGARRFPRREFPRDVHEAAVNLAGRRWYSEWFCARSEISLRLPVP